jgi:hypothetical protein
MPYRIPYARRDEVKKLLDQMLKDGHIVPSKSPWSSPLLLIDKNDHNVYNDCLWYLLSVVPIVTSLCVSVSSGIVISGNISDTDSCSRKMFITLERSVSHIQEIIRYELSSKCRSTPRLSYLSYQLAEVNNGLLNIFFSCYC